MSEKNLRFDYSLLQGKIRSSRITQAELAHRIGLSPSTLSLALNNRRDFTHKDIVRICRELDIANEEIPSYFFCKEG